MPESFLVLFTKLKSIEPSSCQSDCLGLNSLVYGMHKLVHGYRYGKLMTIYRTPDAHRTKSIVPPLDITFSIHFLRHMVKYVDVGILYTSGRFF